MRSIPGGGSEPFVVHTEVEATLVIRSPTPGQVADDVAGRRAIGEYVLRHRRALEIEDRYLDVPTGALGAIGAGLRLRRVGAEWLVALKGPARPLSGGIAREELEDRWSHPALLTIGARLAEYGVPVPEIARDAQGERPPDVLGALGFEVIQRRDLRRRARDVCHRSEPLRTVAELAVDAVSYHVAERRIRHHELEIEVKGPGGHTAMRGLRTAIVAEWGERVRPWRHGKLSTGRAIAALFAAGRLDAVVDREDHLEPAAYDLIARRLGC